ncbi:hypothetical protein PT2222_10374 [Paraburkholderia tropica]
MLLGNHEQILGVRADLLDGGHGGLHGERQHLLRQAVEGAREQIGVDRRELEAGVAQVHRTVERRRVLLPFEAEPALDGRRRVEDALLQFEERAIQRRDQMRDHMELLADESLLDCRETGGLSGDDCAGCKALSPYTL